MQQQAAKLTTQVHRLEASIIHHTLTAVLLL
jgi:hypothetical protein